MNSILPEYGEIDVIALEEGFSNKTYQIRWQRQPKWVLRIYDLNGQAFGIDRQSELEVCQLAAEQGLAAKVIWHDQDIIVWEFLTGQTLPWDVQHSHTTLAPICQAIAELHQLPAVSKHYDVYGLIDDWFMQLESKRSSPEVLALVQQSRHFYSSIVRLSRPDQLVLCHNDLNPKNVLLNHTKAWLIDWESAGMNDPLFDIAVFAHVHHLTDAQLMQAYQMIINETPNVAALQRIEHYRKVYVIRELVWLLLRHQLCGTQDLDCLQWYHALLNDPVFNPYFKADIL